jgi:hypothetical protein
MTEITIHWIGAKLNAVLDEVRGMRPELSAMPADRDGDTLASEARRNKAESPCEVR